MLDRRARPPAPAGVRIWWVAAGTAAVALALLPLVLGREAPNAPVSIPWWALIPLFAIAEALVVHVYLGREAHSFSLSEIPLVLALFFTTPAGVVLAAIAGSAIALAYRRQSLVKLTYNLSHFLLETTVAVLIFHGVARLDPAGLGSVDWIAALLATVAAGWLGVVFVFVAITLSAGRPHGSGFLQGVVLATVGPLANGGMALLGVTVMWRQPSASWLLVLPAATLFIAYRAYTHERSKREGIDALYESTRILLESKQAESAMVPFLLQARKMFQAEIAEIRMLPGRGEGTAVRAALGPGDRVEIMRTTDPFPSAGLWGQVVAGGQAVLLARPIRDDDLQRHFASVPLKDAMIAPLTGDSDVFGTLLVANRLGEVRTFDADDLRLFQALANNVSVAIEAGRLEQALDEVRRMSEQLRHQAFHDPLTDLANRPLLADRVSQVVRRGQRSGAPAALVLLDLDGFKRINDAYGHTVGDEVLRQVARRLSRVLRTSDTVARYGGDEFAILLPDTDGAGAAEAARKVLAALDDPVAVGGERLAVGGSIGIALYPEHGDEAEALLQRADAAMYRAKRAGGGFALYAPAPLRPVDLTREGRSARAEPG